MPLTLSGTNGVSGVDGTAGTPAVQGSDTNTGVFYPAADTVGLATNGTERARVSSDGTFRVKGAGTAGSTDALQISGSAPASAMTLNASGNLGIATTTPQTKLQTYAADATLQIVSSVRNDNAGSGVAAIGFDVCHVSESATGAIKAGIGLLRTAGFGGGSLCFYNNNSGVAGNFTTADEKMRLDSSGNLLVNMTSTVNTGKLHVNGVANIGDTSVAQIRIGVNGDSIQRDGTFYVIAGGSGGVYLSSTATAWSSNSDERLKDIIEPIANAVDKVLNLRTVIGKYKSDDVAVRRSFLIAQDVQSVLPEAVSESKGYLGVAYTDVIPLALAAIKELSAKLDAAEARIAALETN